MSDKGAKNGNIVYEYNSKNNNFTMNPGIKNNLYMCNGWQ